MNPLIQAKLTKGIRKVQGLWGEKIQIGPPSNLVTVPALYGPESLQQKMTATGFTEVIRLPASIAQPDLAAAPVIGWIALARGIKWRIEEVNPTQTTWELILESPKK